tara:strand:- start:453 stop:686 length:234 start_codon:yes stop_codon:yes gene_type:complete
MPYQQPSGEDIIVRDRNLKKGRVSREEALAARVLKEQAYARYERRRDPTNMWARLLNGQRFEDYIMKLTYSNIERIK